MLVYEGTQPKSILNRMATDNLASQLSSSWGHAVDLNTELVLMVFALQGQTFFHSSGDHGAWISGVATPRDHPLMTIVGGTTLSTNGAGSWASETVWNDGVDGNGVY